MGNVCNTDYPVLWQFKHSWNPHPMCPCAPNPFSYMSGVEILSLNSAKI